MLFLCILVIFSCVVTYQRDRSTQIGLKIDTIGLQQARWRRGVVVKALVTVPVSTGMTVCEQVNHRHVANHLGQLSLPSLWGR